MSMANTEALSPAEEWLRREAAMTPDEAALGVAIAERGHAADDLAKVALGIGAGFILYRRYMSRRLREDKPKGDLLAFVNRLQTAFKPVWIYALTPSLISGYRYGLREVGAGNIPAPWLEEVASVYAASLGDHIHELSAQALMEGYQAQLNRRIPAQIALERVINAYGVVPRTMRALVSIWALKAEPTLTVAPAANPLMNRADQLVLNALNNRSITIGETEAYTSRSQAKQILWLYAKQSGALPRTAQKKWVTADDERVCPACGPLHEVTVPVDEQFVLAGDVRVWGPVLHPNCRCDLELSLDITSELLPAEDVELVAKSAWGVVSKARPGDPYDRDAKGRFAEVESRKPKTAERQMDPAVARIIAQAGADAASGQVLRQIVRQTREIPKSQLGSRELKRPVLRRVELENPNLPRREIKPKQMSQRQLDQRQIARRKIAQLDLTKIKMPSRAEIQNQRPITPATRKQTDRWINTPNGEPMYGIFPSPMLAVADDRSLLLADQDVPFYPDMSMDHHGVQNTLGSGLVDYWNKTVFADLAERFYADDRYDPDFDGIVTPGRDITADEETYFIVPLDSYVDIWQHAVWGEAPYEAPDVVVFQISPFADGDIQREREINAADLAEMMGIVDEVAELTPIVGITTKFNADEGSADQYGVASNPGKWRITGLFQDNTMPYYGREYLLPFKMVYIEPDDLFED